MGATARATTARNQLVAEPWVLHALCHSPGSHTSLQKPVAWQNRSRVEGTAPASLGNTNGNPKSVSHAAPNTEVGGGGVQVCTTREHDVFSPDALVPDRQPRPGRRQGGGEAGKATTRQGDAAEPGGAAHWASAGNGRATVFPHSSRRRAQSLGRGFVGAVRVKLVYVHLCAVWALTLPGGGQQGRPRSR
jgi:hypothetical protein